MTPHLKTSAALRASDTEHLCKPVSMQSLVEDMSKLDRQNDPTMSQLLETMQQLDKAIEEALSKPVRWDKE